MSTLLFGYAFILTYYAYQLMAFVRSKRISFSYTFQFMILTVGVLLYPYYFYAKNKPVLLAATALYIVAIFLHQYLTMNPKSFTVQTRRFTIQYYNQNNKKWKDTPYAFATLGRKGCAPAVLSMLSSAFSGSATPAEIAEWIQQNDRTDMTPDGTKTDALQKYAASQNWLCTPVKQEQYGELKSGLASGYLYVAVLRSNYDSLFYKRYPKDMHMVLIYDFDKKYLILDPNKSPNSIIKVSEKHLEHLSLETKLYPYPFFAIKPQ